MGGSQSVPTRKLSIPNDDSHFIKVSDSVAERLKRCTELHPDNSYKNEPQGDCIPTEEQSEVRNKENYLKKDLSDDALINYYYGPSITSLRILQEKEKELMESEQYWTRRVENMEAQHAKLSKIMENEYVKAIDEISCQATRPPPGTPFPCKETKDKVVECFQKHRKEILLCADEVTEFADCVHAKRILAERAEGCVEGE